MGSPITEDDYDYLRSKHLRKSAGISELDSMADIDIIELYKSEFGEDEKQPIEHLFCFNDAGHEFITTQVSGLYVHSELKKGANREIEIMRHHLATNKYKRYFDEHPAT